VTLVPRPHTAFTPRYRYYVLFLLWVSYIFNFIDRQLMTILLEPIKLEFGASDKAMGLLAGFAFAVFYATLGVPVARLADRWSRRNVLAIAMVVWSGMTSLCGMATNFVQLALLRVGVGVGEAGGTPPSHALIADYFPPEQRSTALGIHGTGTQFGVLVGMIGGALIAEHLGWRAAFVIFGLPGVLVGLLIALTVRETARVTAAAGTDLSFTRTVGAIWKLPAFRGIAFAAALTAMSGYGLGTWSPSLLMRVHGLSLTEAGLMLGLVGSLGGLVGAVCGGALCDRLVRRDQRWQLRLPAIGALVSAVLQLLFILWPTHHIWQVGNFTIPVAMVFMLFGAVFAAFWIGPTYAAVQSIAPAHWRTQAAAMLLLIFNLIGMGIGPVLVGVVSDLLTPTFAEQAIRYALAASLLSVLLGGVLYWRSAGAYAAQIRAQGAVV
jgi:MFS family permease